MISLSGAYIIVFCGDIMQKINSGAWYKSFVEDEQDSSLNLPATSNYVGLQHLREMPRLKLVRNIRALEDPVFIDDQNQLKRTDEAPPIPSRLIDGLRVVTEDYVQSDPTWLFAPIAVMSLLERDVLNLSQLRAFAVEFNLVLVRWPKDIVNVASLGMSEEDLAALRDTEPGAWSYFVEGAPANLTETIKSPRGLVNGSPILLESLRFKNDDIPLFGDRYGERPLFRGHPLPAASS